MKDDGSRPSRGLVVTVDRGGNGLLKVMFDELKRRDEVQYGRTWKHETFITSASITEAKLETFAFTSEELEGFAHLVLGMLKVMLGRQE